MPPAPLSMRAGVSSISFFSEFLIATEIDKVFDSIVASCTEKMLSEGEIDVEATLLFKNPQLICLIPLFPFHSWRR